MAINKAKIHTKKKNLYKIEDPGIIFISAIKLPPIQEILPTQQKAKAISQSNTHSQDRIPAKETLQNQVNDPIKKQNYKQFTMSLDKASLEISSILNSTSSHNKLL